MTEVEARAEARLAQLQRDEAMRTLASVRDELTRVLEEHRANELRLAEVVQAAQRDLMQARDTIVHMERSLFWRARVWLRRLRRR